MRENLRYKGFIGSVEIAVEDDCLHGKLLFIEDTVTYEAQTPSELKKSFEEAVDDYIETCKELERTPQKPFKGSFNVRIGEELHQLAAQCAYKKEVSLNEFVKDAIIKAVGEENCTTFRYLHEHTHTVHVQFEDLLSPPNSRSSQWKVEQTSLNVSH